MLSKKIENRLGMITESEMNIMDVDESTPYQSLVLCLESDGYTITLWSYVWYQVLIKLRRTS